jgi:excisionase family DNA binding protein
MQPENSTNISDHQERLWSYSDLAMFLRVSESKLRHDVMARKIPHVRLAGRAVRFVPQQIHTWLADQAVNARG